MTVPDVTAGLVSSRRSGDAGAICSRSPLPEIARSSVEAFAPGMAIPFDPLIAGRGRVRIVTRDGRAQDVACPRLVWDRNRSITGGNPGLPPPPPPSGR